MPDSVPTTPAGTASPEQPVPSELSASARQPVLAERPQRPEPLRGPGWGLVRVGAVILVAGLVLTLVAISPLLSSSLHLPSIFWSLSMASGIGLALLLLGISRVAVARGRRIQAATALDPAPTA